MKKRWSLMTVLVGLILLVGLSVNGSSIEASDSTEAYVIKVADKFYSYESKKLNQSFLNSIYGGNDTLYQDFKSKMSAGEPHAISNVNGAYISYSAISSEFTQQQTNFSLDSYLVSSSAVRASMPNQITGVTINSSGNLQTFNIEVDNGIVPEVINIY
ncbi:hypothetical protein [Radiobacillus deserti]|uniref:Uncharacterized protein n=1 Tax=Radiobacillus deserti TaxID=2594883 RepID=A0A516KJK2_9BACI|nr:hypothetical protein [Radiobacillus deserti]QDP41590.1 hypothetical protein FN924_16285 [Radiobacillus deserti]